jgi:hypothetical protein
MRNNYARWNIRNLKFREEAFKIILRYQKPSVGM